MFRGALWRRAILKGGEPMEVFSEEVTVPTAGERMPCHLARPTTGGPYPGLVVVMEAFGLNSHIKGITDRFAAEGFVAIAPNLYFRTPSNVASYSDLEAAVRLMGTLKDEQIVADTGGAIDYLNSLDEVRPSIGITGFCMGGRIAFLAACRHPAVKAAVPFYGGGMLYAREPGAKAAIEYVAGLQAPVLAFFGGKDTHIPIDDVDKFRDALKQAGKQAEVVLYTDAEHGFMCDERPSYHPTHAKEAWSRTIAFLRTHLG
jgi:carboxymethylenebutenolidase